MKIAIYARVSTTDQTCVQQLREVREYVARRGWEVASEYVDTGWSGSKASRPELDRLMRDAAQHRFDVVAVWALDRFGRSVLNLAESLKLLDSWGIGFIATMQGIDTQKGSPTGNLILWVLAAVAQFEKEMLKERVRAGIQTARNKGIHCGRPIKVFNRDQARAMHRAGSSKREIARALGIGDGTVQRLLTKARGGD